MPGGGAAAVIRTTGVAHSIGVAIERWFLEIVGLDEDAANRPGRRIRYQPVRFGHSDQRAVTRPIMQVRWFIVLLMLTLSACGENPQGEKGDQGPAGPEGAPGPVGAAGMSGTVIRFVEIECRQICFVTCKESERILSSYAINPGGAFTLDADNRKATFRPRSSQALRSCWLPDHDLTGGRDHLADRAPANNEKHRDACRHQRQLEG